MECFVCNVSDSRAVFSVCKCDMCINEACFCRLVSVPSHSTRCAICQEPYSMSTTYKRKIHCEYALSAVVLGDIFATASFLTISVCFYPPAGWESLVQSVLWFGIVFGNLTTFSILVFHHRARGGIGCIQLQRVASHKTLHLPPPVAVMIVASNEFSVPTPL